jgi:hypothetical protein
MKTPEEIEAELTTGATNAINAISVVHILELDLIGGALEIQLYPTGAGWRVETTVEPAEPQFDNFTTRQAAVAFFKNAVTEAIANL